MTRNLSRSLMIGLAGALLMSAPLRAQDDQQSLGDVAKKNRAAKPKAKVTLDEDNSAPAPPPSTSDKPDAAGGQSTPSGDQAQGAPANADSASAQPAQQEDKMAALKKDEASLRTAIARLQDRINNESAADETKDVWRQALQHAQQQLDDNLKQQGSAPAPKPQQ